MKKAFL